MDSLRPCILLIDRRHFSFLMDVILANIARIGHEGDLHVSDGVKLLSETVMPMWLSVYAKLKC